MSQLTDIINEKNKHYKAKELDQMSSDELKELLKDLKFAQMSFRERGRQNTNSAKPLTKSSTLKQTRIQIARVLTILQKRGSLSSTPLGG